MSQKTSASSISQSRTLAEPADFWDTHSLADFEDQTDAVDITFETSAQRSSALHDHQETTDEPLQPFLWQ